MPDVDLIIHNARAVVTCAAAGKPKRGAAMLDLGAIENGAVAIKDGLIAAVAASEEITADYRASETVDASGLVVCPGFVDPHTHIVYAGDRLNEFELKIKGAEYLEILAAGGGILSTVKATRSASLDELIGASRTRLDKMLACGTTTCEIKTGYGLATDPELKMLAAIEALDLEHAIDIVPTFLAAHTVPPEYKGDPDAYVDLVCGEMLPRAWHWYEGSHFAEKRTPFFCDVFTERSTFSKDQTRTILGTAASMGFGLKSHVDQFTNLGGTGLSVSLGAVSVDHLDVISDDEIALLAASDTVGVLIPTEGFSAGKTQFAPARKLIDAGAAVALSTDFNPGSAPCPSMPMSMAIACRYQKILPAEALNAATVNAAHALGLGDRAGSIEAGRSADILLIDAADIRQLAYEFGGNLVQKVFKSGKLI